MAQTLDDLIVNLCAFELIDEQNCLTITDLLEKFNGLNGNTFSFGVWNTQTKEQFAKWLHSCLSQICEHLSKVNLRLATAVLDMVRLVSRDTSTIALFESDRVLDLIQKLSGLSLNEETDTCPVQSLGLYALKSMSNLIYNSKFAQNFYAQNNLAEAIAIFLKQLQIGDMVAVDNDAFKLDIFNTTIFKLRILFLLTVFNRDTRSKLREKLQVTTYLIEIIDLVMKQRLQSSRSENSNNEIETVMPEHCYLKMTDVDLINEILKVLYNLTMDLTKPSLNFAGQMPAQQNVVPSEEEEAHLMHLVSVLRDLITCRLECDESTLSKCKTNLDKIINLHSNIINLLTNMPSICFEELMTPSYFATGQAHDTFSSCVRHLHTKKRQSRRNKRLRHNKFDESSKKSDKEAAKDNYLIDYENYCLINSGDEDLEFEGKNMEAVTVILSFMDYHVTSYLSRASEAKADQLYPVLLLLSLMSKSNNIIRHYSRLKVLPPLKKKDLVELPESGANVRNRLVRLMTDANLQIKRLVAQLLFILCKESVSRLIKYTGYGNAAGLLAEAGLMLSSHGDRAAYSSDSECSDTDDFKQLEECINPITGRAELEDAQLDHATQKYVRTNKKDIFEGLSQEQKEYEAVQLANAIDKLTRISGVIKPAAINADGRVVELQHVLQMQENAIENSLDSIKKKTNSFDHDE